MSAVLLAIKRLLVSGEVAAVVSNRIFPVVAPADAALPYVLVHLVSEADEQMLTGAGEFPEARVQVDIVASAGSAAIDAGEAVKRALQNVTNQTIGDRTVQMHKVGVDFTDYDDKRQFCRRVMEFAVRWR